MLVCRTRSRSCSHSRGDTDDAEPTGDLWGARRGRAGRRGGVRPERYAHQSQLEQRIDRRGLRRPPVRRDAGRYDTDRQDPRLHLDDQQVDLVLHVGDIHSGKQYCTEAYDLQIFDFWTTFKNPVIYTPGDNEWSDCHKSGEGGHVHVNGIPVDYADVDPAANLDLVRSIFFADP